jgi:pimeloyl-ACP methyl ester carboxylesterase
VPSAELVELDGAGHLVILERHAEVTAAIAELAARVDAAGSAR